MLDCSQVDNTRGQTDLRCERRHPNTGKTQGIVLLSEATVNTLTPDEVATMSSPDNEYPVDGLYGPTDDIEIAFRSPFYGLWE